MSPYSVTDQPTRQLISVFNALGDSTRFRLYRTLRAHDEICVSELAEAIGISTAGVSQQLKILEYAGLIERHRKGHRICYAIRDDEPWHDTILGITKG